MYVESGHDFLCRLARALGLDPDSQPIRSIQIDATVDDLVKVDVHLLLDVEAAGRLLHVIEPYYLVRADEDRAKAAVESLSL